MNAELVKTRVARSRANDAAAEVLVNAEHVSYSVPGPGGPIRIVDDVSLEVHKGEFVSIVGPSGCGKTTFMNMIAGLGEPTEGTLTVNGEPPSPHPSRAMYAFARDALMPWRTAQQNIALPLEILGWKRPMIKRRVEELLSRVGLEGKGNRFRAELSQGMRQRVALARALAPNPDLLVMDEPFAALDAQTRVTMQEFLLEVLQKERTTVVFVTHDLEEAIALSDRVCLFSRFPCTVSLDVPVPLARPRDIAVLRTQGDFHAIHDRLWKRLRVEVEAPGNETDSSRKGESSHD